MTWENPFAKKKFPSSGTAPAADSGWVNPFSKKKPSTTKKPGATGQEAIPEPTLQDSFVDPSARREAWDYKTATNGMFGEPLPDNAEGWTPYGTPYFGRGIAAKLKEYAWMYSRNQSGPKQEDWDSLKERWGAAMDKQKSLQEQDTNVTQTSQEEGAVNREQLGVAFDAAKTVWQAGTADDSIVSPVLRALGVALHGVGDLFSVPAIAIERVSGAFSGVREAGAELGIDLPEFPGEADNSFTRYLEQQSGIAVGYTALKIAFSPRKDKWDVLGRNVKDGWDAGRIYYSGVYDKTIKEEFLRRYRAGEDPALLAMELENPIAQATGQFIFDPLNVVGLVTKAKTVDRVLDASEIAVKASGTLADARATDIIDEIGKLSKSGDELKAAQLYDDLAILHTDTVKAVKAEKLTQTYKFTSLAAKSNRSVVVREAQNFIGIMQAAARSAGRGSDEIAEFIKAGVMSVGDNQDEVRRGLTGLMHFDAPNLMFSESGIKTFSMIRKMMETEDGALDLSRILKLTKLENPVEFMAEAQKLLLAGAETAFPTVDELADAFKVTDDAIKQGARVSERTSKMAEQFKRLPKSVLAANFLNGKAQKVYSPFNRVLGKFYFSLQGGVAVKNIIANTVQILIDQGPRAFIRDMEFTRIVDGKEVITRRPAFWSNKKIEADLEKMLGFKTSLASGFETQVDAVDAGQTIFGKLMSAGEAAAANRVVWSSVKDSMRKLFNPRFLGDTKVLADSGMTPGQVNHLMRLFYDNAGDIEKVKREFRTLYGSGAIDEWRTLDFMPKHYEDGFHDLDIYDEIAEFAKTGGKSVDEVESFFAKLKEEILARGATAAQDGARITEETPGFESFQKMADMLHDGDLTTNAANEVLRTWLVAANEARHTYLESLQDTIDWANRTLPQSQGIEFSNRMKTLRNAENAGKVEAEKEAMAIIDSARQYSQEVRNMRNPTPEQLGDIWRAIGLKNQPNADLTKEGLQIVLWKHYRDQKAAVWEKYYGAIFQESRSIVEDLGKVTDIAPLKSKLTQAEMAVERANKLRSSIYRKGTFYVSPGKRDVMGLAKVYDIPGSVGEQADEKMVLDIINRFNGDPGYSELKVGDILGEVPIQTDLPKQSPLSLIADHGGINPAEFSDIVGGKRGVDKAGVMPGLFKNKGAKGIDDVGVLLSEYGFMTREDAADANKVRAFIRKWMDKGNKSEKTYIKYAEDADVEAARASNTFEPYYDDQGNLVVPRKQNQQFTKLKEVPPEVALEAFERYSSAKGAPMVDRKRLQETLVPAYPSGSMPSISRSWNENTRPAMYALEQTKKAILERFGRKIEGKLDGKIEKALSQYTGAATQKITEGKAIALKAAEHWRDFILHNYGAKTYGDLTFAYVMPYQFWYSRTYMNWIKRVASDPHIIAGYAKYKDAMAKLNADKPEFYRGQMEISGAFGIEFEHPLIFNLEAAINPLNGITGVDFNDKEKRVNWWTASLDDMNKFGPSMFAPLQWGIATALSMQGESDAAERWAGRALPETAVVKSGLNWLSQKTGVDLPSSNVIPGLKYGELDPIVNIFSGGLDSYERGRVGNALAQMVSEGMITEEQAIDATNSQDGEIWDEAVMRSSASRLGQNAVSWIAGVGFKPRTESDQQIESMFTELNILRTLNKDGRMTPDQYRQSMDALREKYKFMDAVVLSRRGGDFRDSAFAYNVLGRLPPGASRNVLMAAGLTDSDIQKFYESKGFTESDIAFTDTEKVRFMNAIADLSAMLELPDYATKTEWNEAKTEYKQMSDGIAETLGEDIWDKVSAYYDMRDVDPDKASAFKDAHPEITQALQMKQEGVVNNPLLFEYYGSIDKLEAYYDGKVRQTLFERYGDVSDLWAQYYDFKLQGDSTSARNLWKAHPELAAYSRDKRALNEEANRAYVDVASQLPEAESIGLREDFTPQTGQQEQMLSALQPERIPTWADVKGVVGNDLSPAMESLLVSYWQEGEELSPAAQKQLDYLTSRYGREFGIDSTDTVSMLRLLGVAMAKQGQQPLSQSGNGWTNPFAP